MNNTARYFTLLYILLFIGVLMLHGVIESADKKSSGQSPATLSKAYGGHDHDKQKDIAVLMTLHPELAGTVLDDCRLCHTDGTWKNTYENHCDFCHAVYPTEGYTMTLNEYGKDYAKAGRTVKGMKKIAYNDSDGDGVSNADEFKHLTQPGEAGSKPDLKPAPSRIMTEKDLNEVKTHSQFLQVNAHRVHDVFATYSGWQLYDILHHIGGLKNITHITVISHDGFRKDYSAKEIFEPFPRGIFYGYMDTKEFLGDCPPWVDYPDKLPPGVESGKEIPGEQRLILANRKNGHPLVPVHPTETGRLGGEGPYRTILPQYRNAPPDQSMLTTNPEWPNPFNKNIHHNSGDCARGVIAIGVHPMPSGTKEPDWQSRADELLQSGSIMFFGAIEVETPIKTNQ